MAELVDDTWYPGRLAEQWPEQPHPLARGPRVEDAAAMNDPGPRYGPEVPPPPTGEMLPAPDIPTKVNPEVSKVASEALIPQSAGDWGMMLASGGRSRIPKLMKGAGIAGAALLETMGDAEAAPLKAARRLKEKFSGFAPGDLFSIGPPERAGPKVAEWPRIPVSRQYVDNPSRDFNPRMYDDPRVIVKKAVENTQPEHPAMKELWGVDRHDLWDIGQQGKRQGNIDPSTVLYSPPNPKGSAAAELAMTDRNAQRLIDVLAEARKHPQLAMGMESWYVHDPVFQRMVQMVGKDQAVHDYRKLIGSITPFSSNSEVLSELNRGTAAHMMHKRGEFEDFARHLGGGEANRGADFPPVLRDVEHHMRQSMHVDPVRRFLQTGEHGFGDDTVKNPLYYMATGVPQTGFQTKWPVPDAHYARASGVADTRTNSQPGKHMQGAEYRTFGPWYSEKVAKPLGIEAVPAQGLQWGTFAPYTGVTTPVGASKLELWSQQIWERAQRLGIDPKVLRDQILRGEQHSEARPGMGDLAAQDRYTA